MEEDEYVNHDKAIVGTLIGLTAIAWIYVKRTQKQNRKRKLAAKKADASAVVNAWTERMTEIMSEPVLDHEKFWREYVEGSAFTSIVIGQILEP